MRQRLSRNRKRAAPNGIEPNTEYKLSERARAWYPKSRTTESRPRLFTGTCADRLRSQRISVRACTCARMCTYAVRVARYSSTCMCALNGVRVRARDRAFAFMLRFTSHRTTFVSCFIVRLGYGE